MKLTFLKPNNPYPTNCAKAFRLDKGTKKPVKISDYSLGEYFDWTFVEVDSLQEVYFYLSEYSEGHVRIAGVPKRNLPVVEVRRSKENFPPARNDLLMLDVDKWKCDHIVWDYRVPASIHDAVRQLLREQGFSFLADCQFVCLLSQSQWSQDRISAHLYFQLTDSIELELLHEWCIALRKLRGMVVFDPASERSAQPDYITKRKCVGFKDPMPETSRLSICGTGKARVDFATLREQISRDCNLAGWNPGEGAKLSKIGNTWLETIRLCGVEGAGIHDIAVRAAAQLVQEKGNQEVLDNLEQYTRSMHTELWAHLNVIDPWSGGNRVRSADVSTYTLAKIQQYIVSATDKKYGADVDKAAEQINAAIDAARLGDIKGLFDYPILEAYSVLVDKHPGTLADVRSKFKSGLKGVVTIAEFEKAVRNLKSNQFTDNEGWSANAEGDNSYLHRVISEFDWLISEFGEFFAGWTLPDGRYEIHRVNASLRPILYHKGFEVSGGAVTSRFGETCLTYIFGMLGSKNKSNSDFKHTPIATRVYADGGPFSTSTLTWLHLGEQESGHGLVIKVDAGTVDIISEQSCPIKWMMPESSDSIRIPSRKQIGEKFEDIDALKRWTVDMIPAYFNVSEDDRSSLFGLIFSLLSGRGASPVIEFVGPAGAGKSTAADLLLDLVDPVRGGIHTGAGRSDLGSLREDELVIVTSGRYLTLFDNVSLLNRKQQDTLCQISTGAMVDQRVLYVGTYTKIFSKRPVLLTAIAPTVSRPDLESRTIRIHFSGWQGFKISPKELKERWEKDKPYLYLGLCHLMADMLVDVSGADINGAGDNVRRYWFNFADRLFYNEQEIKDREGERVAERQNSILEANEFAIMLCTWLQALTAKGERSIEGRMLDIFQEYNDWALSVIGTTLDLDLPGGNSIRWKVRTLTKTTMPETLQGFTWQTAKVANTVRDITGWVVSDESSKNRSKRGIVKRWYCNRFEGLDLL